MKLSDCLRETLGEYTSEEYAKNLCIYIFCVNNPLPGFHLDTPLDKKNISEAFAEFYRDKNVEKHLSNSGFWMEVIQSSMKTGVFYNEDIIKDILNKCVK